MKIAVWDTYVTKKDGVVMHFDILVPDTITNPETVYQFGKEYLESKGQAGQPLSSKECQFCHVESMKNSWEESISTKGYYIIEMENCK